jgi:hypothetical protein
MVAHPDYRGSVAIWAAADSGRHRPRTFHLHVVLELMNDTATIAPPRRPKGLRFWAPRLGVLFTTAVICVLLLEIGVRLTMPYFSPQAQIPFQFFTNGIALGLPDGTVRQATPKGDYDSLIHFNGDGFRDSKNFRQASEREWFALGDSYTLQWGVQEGEGFSSRLETLLRTNDISTQIYNIAIPEDIVGYQKLAGYNTWNETVL